MKKSQLRNIIKESIRTILAEQARRDRDKDDFGGRPLPRLQNDFTELCIKKIVPGEPGGEGGSTACKAPPCSGGCGSDCECWELKPPTGAGKRPDIGVFQGDKDTELGDKPMRMRNIMRERPKGGRNICIGNVRQKGIFGQNIVWDNCGPCGEGNACPGGCFCIGPKKQ